jgi:2-dehydro-3-deoxyglucarate aldolase/4-hydroxy-2-oxoheptanedioate aldolase
MRENPVKRRLAAGELVVGTMVWELMTPAVFRIAEAAGADFVLLDQEHPPWGLERVRDVIATGRGCDVVPFVRVPDAEYNLVARVLDAGALGVMVPNCDGAAEAQAVASWARYPPVGVRGFGLPRYDLEPEGVGATLAKANEEQMVIVQIESLAGLEEVEAIARVDGVDLLWIGHFDLTASLGIPGDFENPVFEAAVDRVLAAGAAAEKPVGLMVGSVEDGRKFRDRGFRCLAYSLDVWLYEDALRAGISALRD